jgi:hypothetical protein
MIALSARKLQTLDRPTAAQRNRLFRVINWRTLPELTDETQSRRLLSY